jgi:integrase
VGIREHQPRRAIGSASRRRHCESGRPPGYDFTPHDLRRTAASHLTGELKVSRLVVSKLLNHVERGVTAVYDRASYDQEKRQAVDKLGRYLKPIVAGKPTEKVVELPPAGVRG